MIVLDEQLKNSGVAEQIATWYRGRVINITALRPGTLIKDEAIPGLLRQVRDATFVTINITDFWQQIEADKHYCIACFPLPDDRTDEISELLRKLFHCTEFKTKRARRGKVALVNQVRVRYYQINDSRLHTLIWPRA